MQELLTVVRILQAENVRQAKFNSVLVNALQSKLSYEENVLLKGTH